MNRLPLARAITTLLAALLAVLLAACGTPPGAGPGSATTPAPSATPVPAPAPAATGWRYLGSHSFEKESPGLGVSHRYDSSAGWVDVYVYGLRRNNWANGVADVQFKAHFEGTITEVQALARRGDYTQLEVGAAQDSVVGGRSFRSVSFRFLRGGKPVQSFTYLTAMNGQLVKYRLSFYVPAAVDPALQARQFVEQNLRTGPGGPGV